MQRLFPDRSRIKTETNKETLRKQPHIWILNNTLLNNAQIKEEIQQDTKIVWD